MFTTLAGYRRSSTVAALAVVACVSVPGTFATDISLKPTADLDSHTQPGFRAAHAASQEQADSADARLVAEFQRRVKDYVALHQKLESTLPSLPERGAPQEIEQHQRALERLIDRARVSAKQGDIFSPEIRVYFRRQLARVFSGPEGRILRHELLEAYPRTGVRPQVNERYPDSLPLTPIPAQMLALLPSLPEEIEYRFMGETLILLDRHARLVVDYIERALPR